MKRTAGLMAAVAMFAGCGGTSAVSLSARVGARQAAAQQPLKQGLSLDQNITVDRIRLVVRELELRSTTGVSATPDGGTNVSDDRGGDDHGARAELEKGPYLIDLSSTQLDGNIVQLLATEIPAGSFREIAFKIAPAPGLATGNASVIVNGTIDGETFEFASGLKREQEYEGTLTIGDGQDNVTLNIAPAAWFTDASGARLDPRDAGARAQIEANIAASIDAFEDDDHDGSHDVGDDHGADDVNDDH